MAARLLLACALLVALVSAQTPVPLTLGTPLERSLVSSGDEYFSYQGANVDAQIILTAISGYPSLCVMSAPPPATNCDLGTSSFASSSINAVVNVVNLPAFYPSVVCLYGCNYTIVAVANATSSTNLAPSQYVSVLTGVPQYGASASGSITAASPKFYKFVPHMPGGATRPSLTFLMTPTSGSARMFIKYGTTATVAFPNSQDASTYSYASDEGMTSSSASLVLDSASTSWPADSNAFYIGIYPDVPSATFSVTASMNGESATTLQFESAFVDTVAANGIEYFLAYVAEAGCNVTYSVTPISGDPDLFIETSNAIPYPTMNTCQTSPTCRRGISLGSDSVRYDNAAVGSYHIGVSAYGAPAMYSLLAHMECPSRNSAVVLTDGQPVNAHVSQGSIRYFNITLSNTNYDLTISCTRRSGDPDMYVSNTIANPGPSSFTWRAVASGSDLLTIRHTDPNWGCHAGTPCTFVIGVHGFGDADFTIAATSSQGVLRLLDGVAFHEDLTANQYEYFMFMVPVRTHDITVTVTALGRGDPDLYMSTTNSRPSMTNNMWAARSYTSDAITVAHGDTRLPTTTPYPLYIAVHAYSAISFTVVATLSAPVELQLGVPQTGAVVQLEQVKYYMLTVPRSCLDLTFSFLTLGGSASLFISNTEQPNPANASTYQWSAPYYRPDKTTVINLMLPTLRQVEGMIQFYIGVQGMGFAGSQYSNYTLVAFTSQSTVSLQSGVPVTRQLDQGTFTYFRFSVEAPLMDLAFVVTSITGDPDLYVSTTVQYPNQTAFDWKAQNFGGDVIALPNASVAVYYIGVHAFLNSTFTLVAQLTDPRADDDAYANMVTLTDGQPQTGYAFSNNIQYYGFALNSLAATLSFQLQQQYGDPDLYVSYNANPCNPVRGNFGQMCPSAQYHSMSVGADLLTLTNAQPGFYIIAVHGFSISGFTLTAHASGTSLLLQNGVSVRGDVPRGQYDYYWIPVDSPLYDLTITVTSLSGDTDLFVSKTVVQPDSTHNDVASSHYGSDSITIAHTDASKFCFGCNYYIAVYGYTDSVYTISASFSLASLLTDGVPQSGSVAPGAYVYYRFAIVDPHKDITIAVTPTTGNPNLFVTSNTATYPTTDPTTYEWSSQNWYSGENIVIYHTDSNFCLTSATIGPAGRICMYVIGIYGQTASTFSIQMTSSNAVLVLRDSIPVRDWVPTGQLDYFSYQVATAPQPGSYLTFTVTPMNGDPDLYTSQTIQFPNSTTGGDTKKSNYFGGDSIKYDMPAIGQYYISVHAFLNTTFTLLAQYHTANDSQSVTTLINGVPQDDLVPSQRFRYYKLTLNNPHETLSITLNRRFGDPDLFLAYNRLPTRLDYDRSSMAFGADLITMNNVEPGVYYIGAYGFPAQDSYFTLLASTSDSIVTLVDGSPVRATVQRGEYVYFQVYVNGAHADSDLTISLTPLFGDPDLYVSDRYQRPNRTAYSWQSTSGGGDAVTVPGTTLRRQTYWIGVFGFTNSSFTIVATFAQATQMQDGVPQGGTVTYHAVKQYIFDVLNAHSDATFTLTPLVGQAFLYVSTTQQPIPSDPSTYQYSSTRFGGLQQVIVRDTPATSCGTLGSAQACRFYVAVYGNRFSVANQSTYYSIVASTTQGVVTLQDGVPFTDWTPARQYEYFQINVPVAPAALLVSVTPLTGDPDLYMSAIYTRPNATAFTWRSLYFGADAISVDSTLDNKFVTGTYYISVYAFTEASFTITASVLLPNASDTQRIRLINGQPQAGLLDRAGIRYYTFYVAPTGASMHRQLALGLTPRYGDPDMYIRNDGQLPTPYSYQWKADRVGRDNIVIPDTCEDCEYIIGVRAFTRSLYSLTASTGDAVTYLQSGVAHSASVIRGRMEYYAINVPIGVELFIALQDIGGGDPDLLVRGTNMPTIDTSTSPPTIVADFSQNSFGSDAIDIPSTTVTTYYIGVYGFFNSSYSITASVYVPGALQTLLDGQPQLSFVPSGQYRYFQFQVEDRTATADISFTMTSANGARAQFFVNADCTPEVSGDVAMPTKDASTWASTSTSRSQSRNSITISGFTDPITICYNGTYLVGVYGASPPPTGTPRPGTPIGTQFTFTASTLQIQLSSGQPYFGSVEQNSYKYFAFVIDRSDLDVSIRLSTFGGDADIYVSAVSAFPNQTNYQWFSNKADPNGDSIIISHSDQKRPGQFAPLFVSVHGFVQSFFSIVVSTNFVQLVDGYSQNALTTADVANPSFFNFAAGDMSGNTVLFQFDSFNVLPRPQPNSPAPSMQMWISSVSNDQQTSLLSPCATEPKDGCQSTTASPIVKSTPVFEGQSFGIGPDSPVHCSYCTYYFGVSLISSRTTSTSSFVLTASTNNTVDTLTSVAGKRSGYVAAGAYHYYELFVGTSAATTYSVIVETCSGNADVYAAQDTFTPNSQDWRWKSEQVDSIDVVPVSSKQGFTLHVGVLAAQGVDASYVISAVNASEQLFIPVPGGNGNLKTTSPATGQMLVTWSAASISSALDDSLLVYTVYYAPASAKVVMYSRCGMQRGATIAQQSQERSSTGIRSQLVTGLDPSIEYVFNVLVTDSQTGNYAVYTHTSISGPSGGSGGLSGAMLAVIICVVIVLGVAVAYLFWRNRKLSQELDIEMHDVPKQAVLKATRGAPSSDATKRTEKYSALLQDGALADEEDDYMPPDFSAPAGHISQLSESDRANMLSNAV